MRDCVKDIFPAFSKQFEGYVHWMYLDVKGLVTIGIGNLIDPVAVALQLPFNHSDGSLASRDEIGAEWHLIKGTVALAKQGHLVAQRYCKLRLSDAAIADLVRIRLVQNEEYLKSHYFHDFDEWPADAQLGVLSMAWALGAGFPTKWPQFTTACKEHAWSRAALNCRMKEAGNPGVKPRNDANVLLFNSAADVGTNGLEPTQLNAAVV